MSDAYNKPEDVVQYSYFSNLWYAKAADICEDAKPTSAKEIFLNYVKKRGRNRKTTIRYVRTG